MTFLPVGRQACLRAGTLKWAKICPPWKGIITIKVEKEVADLGKFLSH